MSYVITLTDRTHVGTTTNYKCFLPNPITINKNSYVQIQSAFIDKDNTSTYAGAIYVIVPQLSSAESYWLNQENNGKTGMIGCLNSFEGGGTAVNDVINFATSMPKIPLNNSELVINELDVELRDRENKLITTTDISNSSITIMITDDKQLLS